MSRIGWDEYYARFAQVAALRGTCDRLRVGAAIACLNRQIYTGYNGAPSGAPHCDEVGHLLANIDGRSSCVRVLHAEENAIARAPRDEVVGATIYTTASPCFECLKRIGQARIARIVYLQEYVSARTGANSIVDIAASWGIQLFHLQGLSLDSIPLREAPKAGGR